jgi:hypothetical protein
MWDSLLGQAASELINARDAKGGRLPHKIMEIQALLDIGLKVNKDVMNRVMQRQAKAILTFSVLEVNGVDQSAVSSVQHGME